MPEIHTLPTGPYGTNCYIIEEAGQCLIVDPGGNAKSIVQLLEGIKANPLAILLTHAHFDHIGAVDDLSNKYKIPFYMHAEDEHKLTDPNGNVSIFSGTPVLVSSRPVLLKDESFEIGNFAVRWIHTPGHTQGGVCFLIGENLFTGDTLFYRSVGRSDFPGGSEKILRQSIYKLFDAFPASTQVWPGHGPDSVLSEEQAENPFL